MSRILNLQLSWTVQTAKPTTTGNLVFDGITTNVTYDTVLGAGANHSDIVFAIPTISGATFDPVNYSDTVTLPYPATDNGTELKWTNIYVPDDYVIPPTGGFAWLDAQHDGVAINNVSYNVQTGAVGSLSFGDFQLSTEQNALSAIPGALAAAGLDAATITAIRNVSAVSTALTKIQSDSLAVAQVGIKGFGSGTFSLQQYDAMVNATLISDRNAADHALDSLTLSSNPALDKIAHTVIESDRLIENVGGTGLVPFSASATLGLEVNFGGVLSLSGTVTGSVNAEVVIGGNAGDTVTASTDDAVIVGGTGPETIIAGPGKDYINAGGGNDRVVLTNAGDYDFVDGGTGTTTVVLGRTLSAYNVTREGNEYVESSQTSFGFGTLSNVSSLVFGDGTVSLATHDQLFDPVFYDRTYGDVYSNGIAAETHYDAFGASEGRDPNAMFTTSGYLAANGDVKAAGANPLDHYDQFGWKEGRDPSAGFNTRLYLLQNPDVAAAGIDPLLHYLDYGRFEGRQAAPAIGRHLGPNGFDAEYYLLANPDVAKAGIDPYAHYEAHGRFEGRAANAFFDTAYYLRSNPDVAAAGIDPLLHYDLYGWKEGRNPSASFDTALYLFHNQDVAAAGIDPLLHYLSNGIFEGRADYAVPAADPVGTTITGTVSAGHPGAATVTLVAGQRYTFSVGDRTSQNSTAFVPSPVVSLLTPGGKQVAGGTELPGAGGVQFGFTAPSSGTYTVSVDPRQAGDSGTFNLTTALANPNSNLTTVFLSGGGASSFTAADLGLQYPGSGTNVGIYSGENAVADDFFKFTLPEAAQVELDQLVLTRGVSILDAAGHVLVVQPAASGQQVVASLPAGTFYIDLARLPAGGALPAHTLRLWT